MPAYYHAQDPAQYYSQRQGRSDQKFAQMLQMMMQMQRLKQQQGQYDQERATQQQQWGQEQQRKEKSTDAYVQELERQATKKPKMTLVDLRTRTAEDMVKRGEWTPDDGRRYIEKGSEPVRLPKNVDKAFAAHMKGKYGDDWKDSVEAVQFYEEWDDFRNEQQASSTPKDSLGEIRKFYNRQRNSIRQTYIPQIASADPDEKETVKQALADALNASKEAEQDEIDLFKGVKKKKPEPPPKPELPPGSPGHMESNAPMFGKGGFAAPQATGIQAVRQGNSVVINGASYPINEDGTVTVNGKTFKIN